MIESMSTPGAELGPEHLDDLPFRIDVARFPRLETDDDLVAALRNLRQRRLRRDLDVNVVNDARIVRHDVEEILRLFEGADDRIVRPLEDANDAAFRAIPALRARVTIIARDSRHDLVAVHRRAGVLGRDVEILFARLFARKKSEAGLVNVQRSRDQVRLRR